MILVGLKMRFINAAGNGNIHQYSFEAKDIHEAAVETLKHNVFGTFWIREVIDGEFHDTETHNTWSVDGGGHTKKDYRKETEGAFFRRWIKKTEPLP